MRFSNLTPLPAAIIPCAEGGDDLTALVVCAATFAIPPIRENANPTLSGLQIIRNQRPIERGQERIEPGDDHFIREGVSVTAAGFVYAPNGKATKADASLAVGEEKRAVRAFGPRVWREGVFGALSPTSPLPFDRVPMAWEHAYGGLQWRKTTVVKHEGQELLAPEHPVMYPHNADGMGFFLERQEAVEKPLPQLENPDDPIRAWDDRKTPVCFAPYPINGGMRPLALMVGEKVDMNRMGRLTHRAAPWLIFPALPPGTPISLRGMRPRAEKLAFALPNIPIRVRVILGRALFVLTPKIDAIDIDAESAEVRLVYRCAFRFALIRGERREAYLEPTEAFPTPGNFAPIPEGQTKPESLR